MRKLIILALFFILFSSLAFAASPFITEAETVDGLFIEYPPFPAHKVNTDFKLHTHVITKGNGTIVTNETTSCFLHLYNSTGHHTLEEYMGFDGNGLEFDLTITKGNFSTIGDNAFIIQCNGSQGGAFVSGLFQVTESGQPMNDDFNLVLIIGFGILIGLCLYFSFGLQPEHFILKLFLIFFALIYAMLIPAVVITGYTSIAPMALKLVIAQFTIFVIYFSVSLFIWFSNKSQYMLKNINKIRSSLKRR